MLKFSLRETCTLFVEAQPGALAAKGGRGDPWLALVTGLHDEYRFNRRFCDRELITDGYAPLTGLAIFRPVTPGLYVFRGFANAPDDPKISGFVWLDDAGATHLAEIEAHDYITQTWGAMPVPPKKPKKEAIKKEVEEPVLPRLRDVTPQDRAARSVLAQAIGIRLGTLTSWEKRGIPRFWLSRVEKAVGVKVSRQGAKNAE